MTQFALHLAAIVFATCGVLWRGIIVGRLGHCLDTARWPISLEAIPKQAAIDVERVNTPWTRLLSGRELCRFQSVCVEKQ